MSNGEPFFSGDELAARLQINGSTIRPIDPDVADLLAVLASDTVRDDLRQQIDPIDDDPITLYGDGGEILLLPEHPVTAVTSVVLGGEPIVAFDWRPTGALRRVIYPGSQWAAELIFPWPFGVPVDIVYSHGYEEIPNTIKAVALEVAANTWANPEFIKSKTVGEVSESYPDRFTLTDGLRNALDRYRLVDM